MAQLAEDVNGDLLERGVREAKDINCGDKECSLFYHFKDICKIFLPTNNSQCDIPCKTSGCKIETHHEITCPIWNCHEISTTTSSTLTTDPNPDPNPSPNPDPNTNLSFGLSVFFNVLLVTVAFGIFIWWTRKKCITWRLRREQLRRYKMKSVFKIMIKKCF
jgi:hypothetical protein